MRARSSCAWATALALVAAPLCARAEDPAPGPTEAHARQQIVTGIVTADVGVAALAGGIVMLAVSPTVNPDVDRRHALEIWGGLALVIGVPMAIIGTVVWFSGRKERKDAAARRQQSTPAQTQGMQGSL